MRNPRRRVVKQTVVVMLLICDVFRALSASAINSQSDATNQGTVIEYYKDHEVTERQARESLKIMKESEFVTPAHCVCSSEHKRYCSSENLLKDHCCCNQSHKKEQLYFIPHECYINSDRCYPSLGSCLTVMHIRNCCCDAQLKKLWKSVLAHASKNRSTRYLWILFPLIVTAIVPKIMCL